MKKSKKQPLEVSSSRAHYVGTGLKSGGAGSKNKRSDANINYDPRFNDRSGAMDTE